MTDNTERKSFLCKASGVDPDVLQAVARVAVDLSENGREGKRVGALFVIGDEDEVLRRSHPLILDPLEGHSDEAKSIFSSDMRGSVRELSLLDGAFIVSADGVVVSAARCIDVSSRDLDIPMGLGSRHRAAASVTRATKALAVVVSQSSAVRLFQNGRVVDELISDPAPGHEQRRGVARSVPPATCQVTGPGPESRRGAPEVPRAPRRRSGAPTRSLRLPVKVPSGVRSSQEVSV